MTIPTTSNYPAALDNANSLLGNPVDQVILTLAVDMGSTDTVFTVNESITAINVPTMFVFDTGEIVYVTGKNDGSKQFDCERSMAITHAVDTEPLRLSVTAQYVKQLKAAVIAIETELGLDPAGAVSTVGARIGAIETNVGTGAEGIFADISDRLNDVDARLDEVVIYLKGVGEKSILAVGDGVFSWFVPQELDGAELIDGQAFVFTPSTSGLPTIQVNNGANDLFSTKLSVDINEDTSLTATTAVVVDPTYKILTKGMKLRFDIDIAGTGTKGLDVALTVMV